MSIADIQKMTTDERLIAMEQLWDALCHAEKEPTSPVWHDTVLADRRAQMNAPDARFITLDELRARLG